MPRHPLEIHCTQDGCAAMVVGPLPREWMADADTGDVLCPQHKAQAVWFDDRATTPAVSAERIRAAVREAVLYHRGISGDDAARIADRVVTSLGAPTVDPALCLRLAAECSEDDARMSLAPWRACADVLYSDSEAEGTTELARFSGEAMEMEDHAIARVRNNLAAIIAQLRAAAGVATSIDRIDQGAGAPTAILRETSDPQRPGLIGDETLPIGRGRR